MNTTYKELKQSWNRVYQGKLDSQFYCDGIEIFKLKNGLFFYRIDKHHIKSKGSFTEIEIFNLDKKFLLVFLHDLECTYVEKIKVIESKTAEPFKGFEPNKLYELQNGQIWKQVNGPNAPNHISPGYVKIINDKTMMVDDWSFYPEVILVSNK